MKIGHNMYGVYCIPDGTEYRFASKAVLAGYVHEPETIEAIVEHAGKRPVIHAGVFFGDMLPALVARGVELIYGFEPCDDSWLHACGTIQLNHLGERVALFRSALGEEEGMARLCTGGQQKLGGGAHIHPSGDQPCRITTIDRVDPIDVGVIHLDLEGHEEQALRGARKTIERCRPVLIVETLPAELPEGYTVAGQVHHNHVLIPGAR